MKNVKCKTFVVQKHWILEPVSFYFLLLNFNLLQLGQLFVKCITMLGLWFKEHVIQPVSNAM